MPTGFHVVVAEDGSVPTTELACLGVRPGAHLRLIPFAETGRAFANGWRAGDHRAGWGRRRTDPWLDEAKAERIASCCEAIDPA